MFSERECKLQNNVQIICPHCNGIINIPICIAVNGGEISCPTCQKKIDLRPRS